MLDIKNIMEDRGLDIGLLGAALNISDEEISEILENNDPSMLDDILLGELARVLDIDVQELIKVKKPSWDSVLTRFFDSKFGIYFFKAFLTPVYISKEVTIPNKACRVLAGAAAIDCLIPPYMNISPMK